MVYAFIVRVSSEPYPQKTCITLHASAHCLQETAQVKAFHVSFSLEHPSQVMAQGCFMANCLLPHVFAHRPHKKNADCACGIWKTLKEHVCFAASRPHLWTLARRNATMLWPVFIEKNLKRWPGQNLVWHRDLNGIRCWIIAAVQPTSPYKAHQKGPTRNSLVGLRNKNDTHFNVIEHSKKYITTTYLKYIDMIL